MILVVLLLLGGGAAYFLLYSKQKPAVVVETVPLKNSVSVSPSPGSSTHTVSNDLLSLKFDLPKGYSLVKESEEEYFKRANGDIRKNIYDNHYARIKTPRGCKKDSRSFAKRSASSTRKNKNRA
jgi:hypothetical protein